MYKNAFRYGFIYKCSQYGIREPVLIDMLIKTAQSPGVWEQIGGYLKNNPEAKNTLMGLGGGAALGYGITETGMGALTGAGVGGFGGYYGTRII